MKRVGGHAMRRAGCGFGKERDKQTENEVSEVSKVRAVSSEPRGGTSMRILEP